MRAPMWLLYSALGISVLIAHYVLFLLIRCDFPVFLGDSASLKLWYKGQWILSWHLMHGW